MMALKKEMKEKEILKLLALKIPNINNHKLMLFAKLPLILIKNVRNKKQRRIQINERHYKLQLHLIKLNFDQAPLL